ncbi:RNA-directed DNA polymerase [Janthinobacterium sp. Ant5-2-1]|uniref:RNA-directed DNA polymerase n=1 Tax=Janthinobacterium sp. Ant5-2-1 TaxID=1755239 RepID=UPI0009EB9A6F|nr:RNA-directed DNA polymerase [Janthinobacterium sp. Ant5-2-1]
MSKVHLSLDQTLLVRALNSTKQSYFPTYVGLRILGSQLVKQESNFLDRLLSRRLVAGEKWRYQSFDMYKGSTITKNGLEHEYRSCLAPSPITSLAEAAILMQLAALPAFSPASRAYSYQWPSTRTAGVSYRYFIEGYKERNRDVATALDVPGTIAVITDIRKFYPSATKDQARHVFRELFNGSKKNERIHEDSITGFFEQMLDISIKGIPVGPATSHILGHLVLRDVDAELTSAYGSNYFRYVDDIVVVCAASQEQQVKNCISQCLLRNGFEINDEKTTIASAQAWNHSMLQDDVQKDENFRGFTQDLVVYLALHPDRANELKSMFSENGFSISIDRLKALAAYPRFQYFLKRRKSPQGLTHALEIWLSKNVDFLKRAVRIKKTYEELLPVLINNNKSSMDNHERWQIQRVRRIVNSLFYLRNFGEWSGEQEVFQAFPELVEQAALAQALVSGTVNPILPFYGRGPAAFAELWKAHGTTNAQLEPVKNINNATLDSLGSLRLSAIISENSVDEQGVEKRLPGLISEASPLKRSSPNLSFEDELESLRLGRSGQEIAELIKTRYSNEEGTALDALSLLSSEYRS